ncbi:MAG TPA: hypothetical protein VMP68_12610, partial [Candidatus Eisenbacteria bacterium]|nr:hypothetical protein [Candidatus Eisenbacteria bacterium]
GAIHLAHPACPDQCLNFVRPQLAAGDETHVWPTLYREPGGQPCLVSAIFTTRHEVREKRVPLTSW